MQETHTHVIIGLFSKGMRRKRPRDLGSQLRFEKEEMTFKCCTYVCVLQETRTLVCRSVLPCVAVCCSVLQYVVLCCSVTCLQCDRICTAGDTHTCVLQRVALCCSVSRCVAVCCSVVQCVAVCCSMLQCVAV
jgi:hypothetical protein